jgi:serine/threonine-protein kinase
MEVLRKHMMDAPLKPSSVVSGITPQLDKVILHALAKKVDDRFLTMESFAAAIDKARATLSSDVKVTALAPTERFDSGASATGPTTAALLAHLPVRSRKRTAMIGGAVAILGTALAIAFAHATVKNDDAWPVASESASISAGAISSPPSNYPNQKSLDAVVAAPLSTPTTRSPAITTPAITPPHSSSRPRDSAASTSTLSPKPRAAGDFPDPWSK